VAMRVDGVAQHGLGFREKEFEKRKGVFATTTFKPFRNTEIRVDAEAINREINQPINNLQDQFSGWNGKDTFSTPVAFATLPSDAAARGLSRRAAGYNVYDPYNGY